jgi:hypothetical protein
MCMLCRYLLCITCYALSLQVLLEQTDVLTCCNRVCLYNVYAFHLGDMLFIDGDLIFSNGDGSQYVELDTGFEGDAPLILLA